ncbi:MAG: MFS transporter [Desulfobacteraceae bacterium]|nr:MFS transporter [Desulfobacteraceae bacterium]
MLYSRAFLAMALANLACLSSFSIFYLFPLFISGHEGNQADIGIIMGAFALSSVLCRPWISDMIDKIGRKRSYTLGSLVMTALPLTYLLFRGDLAGFYLPLLFARVVHGVGFAICITAAFTYVADIVPRDRLNEGLGVFGISGLAGSAIGPFVAEVVIRSAGFDALFVLASIIAGISLIAHLPLQESYAHVLRTTGPSFFIVFQKKRIFMVVAVALLFGFGLAAVNNFVAPYAGDRRIEFISLYYISYSGAAIFTRLTGGRLADRMGEDRIIPYGLLLIGVGLISLVLMKGWALLMFSGFVTGCGHGLLYPALNVYAIRGEPQRIRGKITGAFTGSIDGGVFVGSVLLGYVGDFAGFETLFFCSGVAVLSAIVLFKRQAVFRMSA